MMKTNKLIGTIDQDNLELEVDVNNPSLAGFLNALTTNTKMDVIFDLTIDTGSATFTVVEDFNGLLYPTAQTPELFSAQKYALANANFPLLGKGVIPKFVAEGTASATFEASVYVVSYTE